MSQVQDYIKNQPCTDGFFWFFAYGKDEKAYNISLPYVFLRDAILELQKFLHEEKIDIPTLSLNGKSYCGEGWSLWKSRTGTTLPPHLRKSSQEVAS